MSTCAQPNGRGEHNFLRNSLLDRLGDRGNDQRIREQRHVRPVLFKRSSWNHDDDVAIKRFCVLPGEVSELHCWLSGYRFRIIILTVARRFVSSFTFSAMRL